MSEEKIKIGISACLTGQEVRFDKSHKRSAFCMDALSEFVEYQTFCPEVAVGLPVPRPTIRQIRHDDVIKVSRPDGTMDVTEALAEYGKNVASKTTHLSGFIFCAKSPSCGMERVKVYSADGKGSDSSGIGMFARQIMANNPNLPCEENGRLNDAVLRENFVMRVFVYKQWQSLLAETQDGASLTKHQLTNFHAKHKYLLMTHHVESYKQLGKLLGSSPLSADQLAPRYITGLMSALSKKATRKGHSNTLMHLMGYFKKYLSASQKQEILENIEGYRKGLVPLFGPLTLFNHYLKEYPNDYLKNQSYFSPYPLQLRLRYSY